MSKNDEIHELPLVQRRRAADVEPALAEIVPRERLTEAQKDKLVEGGVQAAKDLMGIAKQVCEVWKIREQATADVERIEADHRRIVGILRVMVEHVDARRTEIRERGDVVVRILRELVPAIRDADLEEGAKRALIDKLPGLVREALDAPKALDVTDALGRKPDP